MYYTVDQNGVVVGLYETKWEAQEHTRELMQEQQEDLLKENPHVNE